MVQALDGIRILDLSWGIAGPLGVLLLAEHGADVIKVEPPGGDPFRSLAGYRCWNRSRRSVVIDLHSEEGRGEFLELAATADAVVESFRPGVLARLGVGADALHAANPALIVVSCPAYPAGHRNASRPSYDALVQAASGMMTDQPGWRPGPVFLHFPAPSMGAAYLIPTVLLAALSARERTGLGQHVSTSLLQGAFLYTTQLWQETTQAPSSYHALMDRTYPPGIHQAFLYECAGGEWMHVSVMSGLTPLKPLDQIITSRDDVRGRDRGALIEELRAANYAVDAVTPAHEVLSHPQTIANGTVATVDGMRQMGVPIHLLGTPGEVRGAEPGAGEHNGAIERRPVPRVRAPAPDRRPPLAGIRVLDFGQYLAGPFGPMVLGDLGADVVKIEPLRGDGMRLSSKPFVGCQRGKRSLALDLKHPEGLEVALRLVPTADVVHHNMTRGVAARLGIDYAACRARRADVIYCNTYAYGLPDPLGAMGGLDPLYQASSGLEYDAGAVEAGGAPLYIRFGMCDTSNAMLSVVGVLLALVHRQRTGEGQELWTSLHDGGIVFTSDAWIGPDGQPAGRAALDAGLHGLAPTYRLYRTQDESWICVAAVTAAAQGALTGAVGSDLEAGFHTKTALQWHRLLDEAGVPNEIPVDSRDGTAALHDDDNVRLGLVADHDHPILGTLRQFGKLFDFSATPVRVGGPPPLVGQHSRQVLREAGYRDGDIDGLVRAGAVGEPDEPYSFPI